MRVECKNCGCRIGEMGAISCVGLMIRLFVAEMMIVIPAQASKYLPPKVWSLPFGLDLDLLLVMVVYTLYWLFWGFCPGYFSWRRHRKTECPQCGKRNWSWGISEGWGL